LTSPYSYCQLKYIKNVNQEEREREREREEEGERLTFPLLVFRRG
jgi:hypothetical protein